MSKKIYFFIVGSSLLALVCSQRFVCASSGYDKYGFIDKTGKVVIERKFDRAGGFSEGLAPVAIGKKWGYIDKRGKKVIDYKFFAAYRFSKGRACACVEDKITGTGVKCGCINMDGEMLGEPFSSMPFDCAEGFVSFLGWENGEESGHWGFKDSKGEVIIEPQFDFPSSFSEGLASVSFDDKNGGYIDKTGEVVFTFNFDEFYETGDFAEGLTWFVNSDNKYGYIDKTGEVVIAPQFDFTSGFFQGLASVEIKNKWGFIDKSGKIVIPVKFDLVENVFDGMAAIKIDGKWGYINKTGRAIIPCEFEDTKFFFEGLASVEKGGKWGVIDKASNIIIKPQFDSPIYFSEELAVVGPPLDSR